MTIEIASHDLHEEPHEAVEAQIELEEAAETQPSEKLVPLAESRKYRKRAQAAEQRVEELERELSSRESLLHERDELITHLEQRRRIDELLTASNVVDLEAARLLTQVAIEQMPDADAEEAVEELRRMRPYLFRSATHPRRTGAMAPAAHEANGASSALLEAAEDAGMSGRRGDLLRYLRVKRTRS